uniref:VWF/SSPO/Zonadhesin-like cysteine-rich domain-containing protein n=1 Tax=Pavo cristatus TaxID=9049 RepID=A0A8C9L7S7_PAVCR
MVTPTVSKAGCSYPRVPYPTNVPSSFFIVLQTTFGLQLQIQIVPLMQLFINLDPSQKGQTCGNQSVVGNVLEFANSWKVSSTCPNANQTKDPCTANPYRKSWAQKQCSIITSEVFAKVFAECHDVIPPEPFYKGCVFDGCRITDESMQCSSLEIYATECAARGVCIDWRGKTNNTCRNLCPEVTHQCLEGQEVITVTQPGKCCPTFECSKYHATFSEL